MLTLAPNDRQPTNMAQTIVICINRRPATGLPSCARRGSEALADQLEHFIKSHNLPLTVTRSVCLGHCQEGPTARLAPGGEFLQFADLPGLQTLVAKALTSKSSGEHKPRTVDCAKDVKAQRSPVKSYNKTSRKHSTRHDQEI
jgi:(2Fe-2S) ferredoxin